ncbi:MAG: MlaD protein, partial [Pedosphaera sp.]|nr:MlaD protein [Pedosphaera sp.]
MGYTFALPSANGLKDKADITFRGVQVGYVTDIRLAPATSNIAPGIIATGYITNPQMRLILGDTARVITVKILAEPELEIVRVSASGPPLPAGSTIVASSTPSGLTSVADVADVLATAIEVRLLPPDKQRHV